jgi:hypothetical protein
MRDYSSEEIQQAAEEVKRSEYGDLMFRDPGYKRRSRNKMHPKRITSRQANSSRIRHTSVMITSHRVTSRQVNTSRIRHTSVMVTSRRVTSRRPNTSRIRHTSRRVTSRHQTTSRRNITRWDPNTKVNTFPWAEPVPIRGTFCRPNNNTTTLGT